jgi:hypothetical protein
MLAEQGDDDWVAAMRAGDFARAWAIADRDMERLVRSGRPKHEGPRHLQRIWRGEELRGKSVLVRCYHGLGDTIQFARFLPALAEIAAEVTVWCQPALIGMIGRIPGVAQVLPLHDGTPAVAFDVDIEIMELPHALRADRELIGMSSPYVQLAKREQKEAPQTRSLAVGLVWRVGAWDKRREIPPYLFRELTRLDVRLFSVQRDVSPDEIAEAGATDISTPDIDLLAHRLQTLDLIISVDTMVAHLAGALGRPTWIMLHADGDWRWPSADCQTYWYPQARLFHQHEPGDWRDVVADVSVALQAELNRSAMIAPARLCPPFSADGCRPQADRTDASADIRD